MIRKLAAAWCQRQADVEDRIARGVIENGLDPQHYRFAATQRDRYARLARLLGAK